jgi:hypothetical protein
MFGGGGDAPVANGECRMELLTGVGRGKRPILLGCACLSRSRFGSAGPQSGPARRYAFEAELRAVPTFVPLGDPNPLHASQPAAAA